MLDIAGQKVPWLRRLDHLICEVPNIEEAMDVFQAHGFPVAWPIGRFWPTGRTSGVALGGLNLEFIEFDEGAPEVAQIRTLVFEPTDLQSAAETLTRLNIPMRITDKVEANPDLLQLRGFSAEDSQSTQLICRIAYPIEPQPYDFFLCDYAPFLKARLLPKAFPGVPPIRSIILGSPNPWEDWGPANSAFGLPEKERGCELWISESAHPTREVIEIISDRGPLDFGDWPASFRFS